MTNEILRSCNFSRHVSPCMEL